jgi:general secretion pathway protein D
MTIKSKRIKPGLLRTLFAVSVLAISTTVWAQQPAATLNWKDADIRQVVEAVSLVTGKNFILDPRVTGRVTLLSPTPLGPDALYEAFLSILQVHGYVAVETARQFASPIGVEGAEGPDDIATQVVQVRNVGATQLVAILRPLIPQYGHLVAHAGSNMLIISDRAANIARMVSIIRRIDMASDEDIEVVSLQHASAAEIVRIMTALTQGARSDGAPVATSLVADARTNSVLIGGDKNERLRLRTLIAHLDTPLDAGGDTQVRYLRYADAEELSTKLQQHFTGQVQAAAGGAAAAGPQSMSDINVWADTQTNALVIDAPPKMMRSIMRIVDKLDIRRAQVLVEAIIVEVIADEKNELGVTWAVEGASSNTPVGITNFPSFMNGVVQLGSASQGGTVDPTGLIGEGITVGIGRISDGSVSFAAILRALEADADTNIISTPSVVTTDNEEASLNVGQEVPFVTGSYSNTGSAGGAVNPFQTVQRESIGVKLAITPQINEGDSMLLEISQEISSIAQSAAAVDLITNQRIIETTVIVDDGEILVLGGLLEDVLRESDQRVPVLGSIPVLGALFRSQRTEKVKTNLMIFIKPTILRDAATTAFETNAKYNMIREIQQGGQDNSIQLMPGRNRPMLPPLEEGADDQTQNSEPQGDTSQ